MQTASLHDGRWSSIISRLSQVADLAATARQFGAFQWARKARHAEDLLRLIVLYGPAHLSLRSTAAAADDAGMACLSDKAVLGQLRKSANWLECLLRDKQGLTADATEAALDLALVDGSVICALGSTGTDWRLNARFDPGRGIFTDLVLRQGCVGERVDRTAITAGQTVIQDRGYARVRDFAAVLAAQTDFITRIGWRSLRLLDAQRQALDVMALLPADDLAVQQLVWVKGLTTPLRLIIQRIPPDQAARQQKRVARKASKAGHEMDPQTPVAAGYLMLVTSLPTPAQPLERVLLMYRHRWQIELGFKRLKSIGGIDALPAFDPHLAAGPPHRCCLDRRDRHRDRRFSPLRILPDRGTKSRSGAPGSRRTAGATHEISLACRALKYDDAPSQERSTACRSRTWRNTLARSRIRAALAKSSIA